MRKWPIQLIYNTPTKALQDALSATHIKTSQRYQNPQPIPYNAPAQTNPFTNEGSCQNLSVGWPPPILWLWTWHIGNGLWVPSEYTHNWYTVSQSLYNRPPQMYYQDMIQFTLLQHPNSEARIVAYHTQVTEWHRTNPHSKPDEQHPYPLTPGSVPVGLCEC